MEIITLVEDYLSQNLGETILITSSKPIGGGCINHAAKLETNRGDFFLKWNSYCKPDMFLRESEGLKELAKAADGLLKVPEVFCAKEVDETPGFLIQEYLPPKHANDGDDEKLGRGLAHIHKFENENFGFHENNYCGATTQNNEWTSNWCEFFVENRLRYLLDLIQNERPIATSELEIFDNLLRKIPQLIPSDSVPVLIHGDLWSGNYMISEYGPALIDPAAYYADREMEFAIITMFGGFSSKFYDAYNEVNPLAPDWQSRNDLYQLYHVLNHYYLFGGGYLQQGIAIAKRFI